ADLRLAREPRYASARSGERSGREPPAGLSPRDAAVERSRYRRGVSLRVHSDGGGVRDAVARRRHVRLHVRQPDQRPVRDRLPRLADGLGALAIPPRGHRGADCRVRAVQPGEPGGLRLTDVALSTNGRRALRVLFGIVIVFLYAPIAIL